MQKVNKNYYIELLRFVFCILILLHHSGLVSPDGSGLVPSAGVLADAFFIITGYFTCCHVENMDKRPDKVLKYSYAYTFNKLKRVLPYSCFGVLIIYILELLHMADWGIKEHLMRLYYMLVELLLLPMLGIMEVNLINLRNAPLWYLSATLIALPIVLILMLKCSKPLKYALTIIIPFLLELWMVRSYGGALPWMDRSPVFIYSGAIRGFSSIMLGCLVYYLSDLLTGIREKERSLEKLLLTLIELGLLVYVLYNILHGIGSYMEMLTIYLIALMLLLTLSGLTYTSELRLSKLGILGKLSLPIYCIHWGVFRWVGTYLGMLPYAAKIILTIVLCIIASLVLMKGYELFQKKRQA